MDKHNMDKRKFYRLISKGFHALAGISLFSVLTLSLMTTPAHGQLKSDAISTINTNLEFSSNQTFDTTKGNLPKAIGGIIQVLLGLLGIIAIALIIYAGFIWMTARGEEGKVEDAQKILKNAIWGLAIVILAYALTNFIVNSIIDAGKKG